MRSFPIEINDVPQEARTLAWRSSTLRRDPRGRLPAGSTGPHAICRRPPRLSPRTPAARGRLIWCRAATAIGRPWRMAATTRKCTPVIAAPQPPDATHSYTLNVYALDCELGLPEGFYLNELRRAMSGHVLESGVRGAAEPRVGSMRCAAPFDSPDKGDSYSNETDSVVWRCME